MNFEFWILNCGTSGTTGGTSGKDWTGGRNGKAKKAGKAERAGNVGAIVGQVRQVRQVGRGENYEFWIVNFELWKHGQLWEQWGVSHTSNYGSNGMGRELAYQN